MIIGMIKVIDNIFISGMRRIWKKSIKSLSRLRLMEINIYKKQPFTGILLKSCSEKFHKIYNKAALPGSLFNKVSGLQTQDQFLLLFGDYMKFKLHKNGKST